MALQTLIYIHYWSSGSCSKYAKYCHFSDIFSKEQEMIDCWFNY